MFFFTDESFGKGFHRRPCRYVPYVLICRLYVPYVQYVPFAVLLSYLPPTVPPKAVPMAQVFFGQTMQIPWKALGVHASKITRRRKISMKQEKTFAKCRLEGYFSRGLQKSSPPTQRGPPSKICRARGCREQPSPCGHSGGCSRHRLALGGDLWTDCPGARPGPDSHSTVVMTTMDPRAAVGGFGRFGIDARTGGKSGILPVHR